MYIHSHLKSFKMLPLISFEPGKLDCLFVILLLCATCANG